MEAQAKSGFLRKVCPFTAHLLRTEIQKLANFQKKKFKKSLFKK